MSHVIFRSFDNYIYANILLLRLKSEGIDCYLKDENTITIDPLLSPALGGMKLMVRETDITKANNIVDQFEEAHLQTLACPECGRKNFQRIVRNKSSRGFLDGLISRLIHGSEESKTITYRCHNCGFTTKDISSIPQEDF
jgi:predicted RNA-binding Zn-ribbon protein involved in translation (DUF1610 family)